MSDPGNAPASGRPGAQWLSAGSHAGAAVRTCPFCAAPAPDQFCGACRRDTTAPRRPCASCGKMVPGTEQACWNCGAIPKSDLRWKIPVIIALFVAAFVIALVLGMYR